MTHAEHSARRKKTRKLKNEKMPLLAQLSPLDRTSYRSHYYIVLFGQFCTARAIAFAPLRDFLDLGIRQL